MASFFKKVQRDAYLISRTAGDLDAARRGPDVLARRIIRREVTRSVFRAVGNGRRGRWF